MSQKVVLQSNDVTDGGFTESNVTYLWWFSSWYCHPHPSGKYSVTTLTPEYSLHKSLQSRSDASWPNENNQCHTYITGIESSFHTIA